MLADDVVVEVVFFHHFTNSHHIDTVFLILLRIIDSPIIHHLNQMIVVGLMIHFHQPIRRFFVTMKLIEHLSQRVNQFLSHLLYFDKKWFFDASGVKVRLLQ